MLLDKCDLYASAQHVTHRARVISTYKTNQNLSKYDFKEEKMGGNMNQQNIKLYFFPKKPRLRVVKHIISM